MNNNSYSSPFIGRNWGEGVWFCVCDDEGCVCVCVGGAGHHGSNIVSLHSVVTPNRTALVRHNGSFGQV